MSASLKLTAKLTGLDYSGVSCTLRNDEEKRRELLAKAADMQKDYQP